MNELRSAELGSDHGRDAGVETLDLWDVGDVVHELAQIRRHWRSTNARHVEHGAKGFPSRVRLAKIAEELSSALFPLRLGPDFVRQANEDTFITQTLQIAASRLHAQLRLELAYADEIESPLADQRATEIVVAFLQALPNLRRLLDLDIQAAFRGIRPPAASTRC